MSHESNQLPFIDFLNEVDAELERHGQITSTQEEMDDVEASQQSDDTPLSCARHIIEARISVKT